MLSEKFAMTHALNYTKHHTTGKLIITIASILFFPLWGVGVAKVVNVSLYLSYKVIIT